MSFRARIVICVETLCLIEPPADIYSVNQGPAGVTPQGRSRTLALATSRIEANLSTV